MVRPAHREFATPVIRTIPPARPTRSPSGQGAADLGVSRGAAPDTDVFAASWCCSVGTTWTVELRSLDREAQGRPAEWIYSGVPTQQPPPERQTADLLRERGLLLFPVEPADPEQSPPRSRSRRPIGYVTRNPELMRLALALAKVLKTECDHPIIVAARWMRHGYTADTTLRWVAAGVTRPELAAPKRADSLTLPD